MGCLVVIFSSFLSLLINSLANVFLMSCLIDSFDGSNFFAGVAQRIARRNHLPRPVSYDLLAFNMLQPSVDSHGGLFCPQKPKTEPPSRDANCFEELRDEVEMRPNLSSFGGRGARCRREPLCKPMIIVIANWASRLRIMSLGKAVCHPGSSIWFGTDCKGCDAACVKEGSK
jgi:hypothetical protein